MRYLRYAGLLGLFVVLAGAAAPAARAQVRFSFGIGVGPGYVAAPEYVGPPPDCPYGYYGYYPYTCAPYGYYGPDYFDGGVFIGAGPWFGGSYGGYYGPGYRFFGRDHDHDRGFRGGERFRDFRGGGHDFLGDSAAARDPTISMAAAVTSTAAADSAAATSSTVAVADSTAIADPTVVAADSTAAARAVADAANCRRSSPLDERLARRRRPFFFPGEEGGKDFSTRASWAERV